MICKLLKFLLYNLKVSAASMLILIAYFGVQKVVSAEDWSRRLSFYLLFVPLFPQKYHLPLPLSSNMSPIVGLNNLLMAYEDKSAYALCAFSFALGPDAEPLTFLGKTQVHNFMTMD